MHGGLRIDRSLPRDDVMYRETDALDNVSLENSKPYREEVIQRKKKERLDRARNHGVKMSSRINPNDSFEFVGHPKSLHNQNLL